MHVGCRVQACTPPLACLDCGVEGWLPPATCFTLWHPRSQEEQVGGGGVLQGWVLGQGAVGERPPPLFCGTPGHIRVRGGRGVLCLHSAWLSRVPVWLVDRPVKSLSS